MNINYQKALVLDSSHIARSIITTHRAFSIFYKGNAVISHTHPESFQLVNKELDIKKPSIIIVKSFVNIRNQKSPCNRENIYKRDDHTCVYCEKRKNKLELTLDHVIPQSKGGENSWENLVTACKPCNSEKADLELSEFTNKDIDPKRPHYLMLLKHQFHIPEEWKPYLFF